MLAKETDKPFSDKQWLFEIKWDGYRAISEITKDKVELYSRNSNSFNTSYPIIVDELKKIKQQVVLDGEVVVLNEKGKSDFQLLQQYGDNPQQPLCYYVFDLLSVDGKSIYDLPLIERKKLLKTIIKKNAVIKYSDHVLENGIDFFKAAQKQDLEGIMAKKIDSQYYPGVRTGNWLKIKHHKSADVVIVGFTQPRRTREYFGALVLAIKTKNGFKYAGHTGSGFNQKSLKETYSLLKPLVRKDSPLNEIVKTNMPVTWVEPKYICEVKYTEWTNEGSMRHPIFLRIRDDKSIKDI
jgi:bifunctional non-homologous end joining protein LigD